LKIGKNQEKSEKSEKIKEKLDPKNREKSRRN
jgi:hypothetical protein